MSQAMKVAIAAAFVTAISSISQDALARGGPYPMTSCGPGLTYLCPIHGYFDMAPFRYGLAIYPGCIKVIPVQTPNGIVHRRAIVCG
jgi:hypothetical protein